MAVGGAQVDVGTGAAITWASYTANILSISWSGISSPAIETTYMATAGGNTFGDATFMQPDHADPGEITVEYQFNPDTTPPIGEDAASFTLTFPTVGTDVTPATFQVSAFCKSFELGAPLEGLMTATAVLRATGPVTTVKSVAAV